MTKTYLTGRRLLATFITMACAVAVTNIATAQVMSPNGKVEWKEKGKVPARLTCQPRGGFVIVVKKVSTCQYLKI